MPLDNSNSSRSFTDILKDVGDTVAKIGGAVQQTVTAVKGAWQQPYPTGNKGAPSGAPSSAVTIPSYPMPQEQGGIKEQPDNKGYFILVAIIAGIYLLGRGEA